MRIVTKILVEMIDDETKIASSVLLEDGKIVSKKGEQTKTLDDKVSKMICEQLNAQMGMAFSKL